MSGRKGKAAEKATAAEADEQDGSDAAPAVSAAGGKEQRKAGKSKVVINKGTKNKILSEPQQKAQGQMRVAAQVMQKRIESAKELMEGVENGVT
jgi:hypothetical protein